MVRDPETGLVVGSIRAPVSGIGGNGSMAMVGPLAVRPDCQGKGLGTRKELDKAPIVKDSLSRSYGKITVAY